MKTKRSLIGLVAYISLLAIANTVSAQTVTVQDLGANNPINCSFSQYDYCQSEAALNGHTTFVPVSDPPANTFVHFSYRGPGNSNYLSWPVNFKASSANGISNSRQLVQYVQSFATGPWDQEFFFDGTNYVAETPGEIAASASSWSWVFTNYLVSDVVVHGFVQTPIISRDATVSFVTSYVWIPTLTSSVTLTVATSTLYSGVLDLVQDSVGGHQVAFVAPSGVTLLWATPTGDAPSLNTNANAHNFFMFYAASPTAIVAVPVGSPLSLVSSVNIGSSQISAGECSASTLKVSGAMPGDVVDVTPLADPNSSVNDGIFFWNGLVTAPNTVVVKLCATATGVPIAQVYNVRILQ